jgi:hypothetical protein
MNTHTQTEAKSTTTLIPAMQPAHSSLLPQLELEEPDRTLLPTVDWLRSPSSPTSPPINPSVGHSFGSMAIGSTTTPVLQRMAIAGNGIVQRQVNPEEESKEEEPIQAKAIARSSQLAIEEMQALYGNRAENQRLASQPIILQAKPMFKGLSAKNTVQNGQEERKRSNQTGLPDVLKAGVESLSGYSLEDVRVHYNSPKPAQLQALAYTRGTEIYVAPGQEKHLPHEAWHAVQQMMGRVKPMKPMMGEQLNDDEGMEREASEGGRLAIEGKESLSSDLSVALKNTRQGKAKQKPPLAHRAPVTQRMEGIPPLKFITSLRYFHINHNPDNVWRYVLASSSQDFMTFIDKLSHIGAVLARVLNGVERGNKYTVVWDYFDFGSDRENDVTSLYTLSNKLKEANRTVPVVCEFLN